jgi:hypothetical protein
VDVSTLSDAGPITRGAEKSDARGRPPPLWLQCAAVVSLAGVPIGVIAVLVHPSPLSGAIFPLALASIWLTGWAAGERR